MKGKFILYALVIAGGSTFFSWSSFFSSIHTSGYKSGSSWHSRTGSGGGSWGSGSGGGGHK
ncbi:MAG: hypothetical protein V4525_03985 [Pseudomonadota bacterium]